MNTTHLRRLSGLVLGAFLSLLIVSPHVVRGQEVLFGITFDTNELIRINTTTGVGTPVGPIGFQALALGISNYQGELYVLDQTNDQLVVVNPNTAATVRTIPVFDSDSVFSEGDFEIRASDGKGFYTESNSRFNTVNITTGAASLINSNVPLNIDGLSFAANGTLYALEDTGALYTMDPNTGATALIGGTGGAGQVGGMDFRADGTLFAISDSTLFTINPATGARSLVGNTGTNRVSGLTFMNIPEPASVVSASLGLLLLARRARR